MPLDAEQQKAVDAPAGPLLIVAGAGTGKTTALTARIAAKCSSGEWEPRAVLALTHSSQAAGRMHAILSRDAATTRAVTARTFHAAALSLVNEHWQQTGLPGARANLVANNYGTVRDALRTIGMRDVDNAAMSDILTELSWAKSRLLTSATYPSLRTESGMPQGMFARLLRAYTDLLAERQQQDFTDLLTLTTALLDTGGPAAVAIRARFRHFLVDEYQDTDPAQQALLDALLGGRTDVTAVGDPRQAIFSFKGSDPQLIRQFPDRYPGAQVVSLVRDYRSTPQIVAVANTLTGASADEQLIGMRDPGPAPTLCVSYDEAEEAETVADLIARQVHAGTPAEEIALLVRFNAQTAAFEQALTSRNIPYIVLDNDRFFDRPEVAGPLARAWDLSRPGGPAENEPAADLMTLVLAEAGFDRDRPPAGSGAARDRWEAQLALLELVREYPDAETAPPREILADVARRRAEAHTVTSRAVVLTTLHKSKGLEWDVVVMPRLVEGSLPSSYATDPDEIDEERRLAYVGFTRARQKLICSYAKQRGTSKRRWPATPSRFLTEAGIMSSAPASAAAPSAAKTASRGAPATSKHCRECGVALRGELDGSLGQCRRHLSDTEEKLLTALLEWRSVTAAAEKMPEFSIMSERTMAAIVTSRPATRGKLAMSGGFGSVRAAKYEKQLLALVRQSTAA